MTFGMAAWFLCDRESTEFVLRFCCNITHKPCKKHVGHKLWTGNTGIYY